jgi:hypothetical protein
MQLPISALAAAQFFHDQTALGIDTVAMQAGTADGDRLCGGRTRTRRCRFQKHYLKCRANCVGLRNNSVPEDAGRPRGYSPVVL